MKFLVNNNNCHSNIISDRMVKQNKLLVKLWLIGYICMCVFKRKVYVLWKRPHNSQEPICTQNSNNLWRKWEGNLFQKRNPSHLCIRPLLTKEKLYWHLHFSPFLYHRDIFWLFRFCNYYATLALLCSFFFFLSNLNSTDNKWHLNSPQGSTSSCQRELQYRVWRNQCAGACVSKSKCMSKKITSWKLIFVHVCLSTHEKRTCVHLCCLCVWERPSNNNTFM